MREGWTRRPIGELIEQVRRPVNVELDRTYVELGTRMHFGGLFEKEPITGEALGKKRVFWLQQGDLVLNIIFAVGGAIAVAGPEANGRIASHRFPTFRARGNLCDVRFLRLFFETAEGKRLLLVNSPGSAGANRTLSIRALLRSPIPAPPLQEQRRIVDLIGSLDATRESSRRIAAASDVVATNLVDDAIARAEHWTRTKMGAVLEMARGGSPRPIEQYLTSDPEGINWIKIGDVAPGDKYVTRTAERIRREGISRSRWVDAGDFILSNSMSFGRPYIMSISGCIHDGWLVIRDTGGSFDQSFLYWLLRSSRVQDEFHTRAAGSGVRNLNIGVVSDVEIPLPPVDEQRAIARAADAAAGAGRQAQAHAEALAIARLAVLRDLLSGAHIIPDTYDRLLSAA